MTNNLVTRAYNSFKINEDNQTIIKSSKTQRLFEEIDFYRSIPDKYKMYFPKVFGKYYNALTKEVSLELELYGYDNLGKYLTENKLSFEEWEQVAQHLLKILNKFSDNSSTIRSVLTENLKLMYENKTDAEYCNLIASSDSFKKLCTHKKLKINGIEYENYNQIWPKLIKNHRVQALLYEVVIPAFVHGDLCFSNILFGQASSFKLPVIKLIDPRGKFGRVIGYGDAYYDLAKLMHSTDIGYEYIIFDKFMITNTEDLRDFSLAYVGNLAYKEKVNKIFEKEIFNGFNVTKIKLLEAMIYIGMCARHYDNINRQKFMYLSGVKLLNEVAQQI